MLSPPHSCKWHGPLEPLVYFPQTAGVWRLFSFDPSGHGLGNRGTTSGSLHSQEQPVGKLPGVAETFPARSRRGLSRVTAWDGSECKPLSGLEALATLDSGAPLPHSYCCGDPSYSHAVTDCQNGHPHVLVSWLWAMRPGPLENLSFWFEALLCFWRADVLWSAEP